MTRQYLIFGASSFIGAALTEYLLERGDSVVAIVRDKSKLDKFTPYPLLHIVESVMADYKNLSLKTENKFDTAFYFTWDGSDGDARKNYHLQIKNIEYVCDVFQSIASSCKSFIYVGTIFQFLSINNTHNAVYAEAKSCGENFLRILAKNATMSFNATYFSHLLFGPGDASMRLVNLLIYNLLQGKQPPLVKGNNFSDWIYIDDVVRALALVADKGVNGKSYYIGNRQLKPLHEIISDIGNILCPTLKLEFGGFPDESYIDYSKIDLNVLANDTGFKPECDFKCSILKTAEWVRRRFF
jgi:nucleoside-diphosphate-sugar epimerase